MDRAYRNRKFMIPANGQWCPVSQTDKGHMIFNLLAGLTAKAPTVEDAHTAHDAGPAAGTAPLESCLWQLSDSRARPASGTGIDAGSPTTRTVPIAFAITSATSVGQTTTAVPIATILTTTSPGSDSSSTSSRSSDESEPSPDFDDDGDDALLGIDVNPFGDEFPILEAEFSLEGPPPLQDDQHPEDAEVLCSHFGTARALRRSPRALAGPAEGDLGDLRGRRPLPPVPGEAQLRPRHR